jgi:hypothetical protein
MKKERGRRKGEEQGRTSGMKTGVAVFFSRAFQSRSRSQGWVLMSLMPVPSARQPMRFFGFRSSS